MSAIITKEELEAPRTTNEILDWVRAAHDRFRATKELRAAARDGKFFAKELAEESFPIALFAHRFFNASDDVLITQVIGSQKYDAVVDDRREEPSGVKFIEATVSDWSYEESLRMELLNKDGHVAGYGQVRAEGARGNRKVLEADSIVLNHEDVREQHLAGVIAAVTRKSKNEYHDGTALVVRIDDALPFRDEEDISVLDDVATSNLVPVISGREFRVLALVGTIGAYLSYEL